jgi:probable rRNA maturation factor
VSVAREHTRIPLSADAIERLSRFVLASERVRDALVSIAFVTPRAIARINGRHLGHRGPTDVISFAFRPRTRGSREPVVADIYIAPDVARVNARNAGVSVREELQRLTIHGTLHALGWDHPANAREKSKMWARQERLLRAWEAKA